MKITVTKLFNREMWKFKVTVITGLMLACLLGGSCSLASGFDKNLDSIVEQYRFNIAAWEFEVFPYEASRWICDKEESIDDAVNVVNEYFSATGERKEVLEDTVEKILEKQIEQTLIEQDIFSFPPVNFRLDNPPNLLVISPRDRIESMREITLQQNLSSEGIKHIEAEVDKLGVSSLVVELGGIATYPSFVANDTSLRVIIDTATEEWVHQYLAFKPLGFLYILDLIGVSRNYDIATMNETVASIVSKEISSTICAQYYPEQSYCVNQKQVAESEFDFNLEMREIRRTVDAYLAQGEVERAEEFMEKKRQYLATMGYNIRKLNQAYFAFHGAYADRPTSVSPIGLELKQLRTQSDSLKKFLLFIKNDITNNLKSF